MKNIIVIICIAASAFTINSCKKDDEKKEYTITGRIVQSCDNPTPVNNQSFKLKYLAAKALLGRPMVHEAGSCTTDKDGYFTITYVNIKQDDINLELIQDVGFGQNTVFSGIPQNTDLNVKDIYLKVPIYQIYKIKLSGISTSKSDTLIYEIGGQHDKNIIGPFLENQILDTILFYSIHSYKSLSQPYSFTWRFSSSKNWTRTITNATLCNKYNDAIIDLSLAK